ncbi:MAG: 3,4-dihydroxy-2-butanone-4-phosphate synthase [Nitrospira sp.]|nr:3,4-dihydroxy-2-butanone-4-phosphate synthase [Nitrospira sp.]
MAKHARGLICLALTPGAGGGVAVNAAGLGWPPSAPRLRSPSTARKGITTGISAADRAPTIHVAVDSRSTGRLGAPRSHFPLKSQVGGVLRRAGQTEGSVDVARLADSTRPASSARS